MSAPALNNIDLSGEPTDGAPALSSIDLTGTSGSDPEGVISAELEFSASFVGEVTSVVSGDIESELSFSAAFSGGVGAAGSLVANLDLGASFTGAVPEAFGVIGASLGFTSRFVGYQDWAALLPELRLQEVYVLTLTGSDGLDDIDIPISAWQATSQAGGRSSYLQATIPNFSDYLQAVSDREDGELIVKKGYRLDDGSVRTEEILRSSFETFRHDRGPRSFTGTISGYRSGQIEQSGYRVLSGVRSMSLTNGKHRVRCNIDLFLRPGMTVEADGTTFKASYINYYVSSVDKFCEVGQS